MTFANLPGVWVIAGLAGLAAALFVLQQLRTRYRDVTVVTTIFWRQVMDEAPVRTLRERFRHPWAYALVLAICALVWLSLAQPEFTRADDGVFHVLVLDGSAGMASGDRFARAVDRLERQVARLPRARRQVIWAGAGLRPLLNPGEHELLLSRRLQRMSPDTAPASVERLLRQLSASAAGPTSVVVFGDAPVRRQVLDLVPTTMTVARAGEDASVRLSGNAGITALGVADAASGAWDKVDVFVDVTATADRQVDPAGVAIDLDGKVVTGAIAQASGGRPGPFVLQELPASGGLLTVRLTGADSLSLDDTASVRLPDKPLVKVLLSPSLAGVIGPVLNADRGITPTGDGPHVVIRRAGETVGGALPALEFVRSASQPQAFFFTHPASFDSSAVLAEAVADIGLTQIDAMSLAQSSGRPIEVSIGQGPEWRVSVWEELLSDDYDFTRSRAFPLFVANAVRWLAGTDAWYPYAAAGRPLSTSVAGERPRVLSADGRVIDPLGVEFVPAGAGELRLDSGQPLAVSLLDRDVTSGVGDTAIQPADLSRAGVSAPAGMATWLLLLAVALLALEWHLFQRGRIP